MWITLLCGGILVLALLSSASPHILKPKWHASGKVSFLCTITQNIFISGGSQGLGLALAKLLASAGANIVICSRSIAKLERGVVEIDVCKNAQLTQRCRRNSLQKITYVAADVSTFEGACEAIKKCPFVPDTVFCCAGGAKPGFFAEQTESDFEDAVKTDYFTALSTAHVSF